MHYRMFVIVGTTLLCTAACTSCATASPRLKHRLGAYRLEVLVDGRPTRTYYHRGQAYVMGRKGRRYTLRIHNNSSRRIEAVVTVDGRDVLDGKTGSWTKRGYLVPAWGHLDIDGWRVSSSDVAAFRFSSVKNSYAARTGSARHVGVVGVAVFAERRPAYTPPPYYAPPYQPKPWRDEDYSGGPADDYEEGLALGGRGQLRKSAPAASESAPAAPRSKSADGALRHEGSRSGSALHRRSRRRPGLATAFGERRYSPVREVSFTRAHATRPSAVLGVRYNDRRGLLAMGVDLTSRSRRRRDTALRRTATPFPASYDYAVPPPGWH